MGKIALMVSLDVLKYKIEKSLQQFGFDQTISLDYQKVTLSLTKLTDNEVDLIILDIDNPNQDAFEIISKLKNSKRCKSIPLVAIGNTKDKAIINKLVASGCIEYFTKPLEDIAFVGKIQSLIHELEQSKKAQTVNTQSQTEYSPIVEDLRFTWSPIFKTDIEIIDNEHLKIVLEYEKLYSLMKSGAGHDYYVKLLDFLDQYIATHFASEELFMKEFDYPELENHISKHRYFSERISQLKGNLPQTVTNEALIKINLFIKEWLVQHILSEDQKMALFIKNSPNYKG